MAGLPAQRRLQKLADDISILYTNARAAQVTFAWETGRMIVKEEQRGSVRASYGARLISELSRVLRAKHGPGFSENTLRKMRQFYSLNPIQPPAVELDWTAYVELMPLKDPKVRKRLERRILKEGLKSFEIRQEVKRLRRGTGPKAVTVPSQKSLPPLKRPERLKLNTFSLPPCEVEVKTDQAILDCGLFARWTIRKSELKKLNLTDAMSYTYSAAVKRVIDGDTLLLFIEMGFGVIIEERLRLRGIDCPELSTPEGQRAKRFVQRRLPVGSRVILKTQKCRTDIYGRFSADVLFLGGADDPQAIIRDGIYLNQLLLDEGHAVRAEW